MPPRFIIVLAIILIFASAFLAKAFAHPKIHPWVKHLELVQAAFTIAALIIGVGWYTIQRPYAPKLKFDESAWSFALDSRHALIIVESSFSNVGNSSIDLRNSVYKIFFQQVTPLTSTPLSESGTYSQVHKDTLRAYDADNWSKVAERYYPVNSFLETGETENIYSRLIVDCQKNYRISVLGKLPKPLMWYEPKPHNEQETKYYIKQVFVDLTSQCKHTSESLRSQTYHRH